ncbi:MAG: CPBP family intramembrane metalloprotease, partial [Sphingobacteriales bacterium]
NMILTIEKKTEVLLSKLARLPLSLLLIAGLLILAVCMFTLAAFTNQAPVGVPIFDTLWERILVAIFVAPLLETLLFQYAIIETCRNQFKSYWIGILFSALAFGISHHYSSHFVIATTFAGFDLAVLYAVLKVKGSHPFWYVTLIHATFNLFITVMKYITDSN